MQVSDLEETLDRLENRCSRFVKGSKKYKEGVNTLSQSQLSFADFLEEFCGGTDEESMMLGRLQHVLTTCICGSCQLLFAPSKSIPYNQALHRLPAYC